MISWNTVHVVDFADGIDNWGYKIDDDDDEEDNDDNNNDNDDDYSNNDDTDDGSASTDGDDNDGYEIYGEIQRGFLM